MLPYLLDVHKGAIADSVMDAVEEFLKKEGIVIEVTRETSFSALGIDEIKITSIVLILERNFGIEIYTPEYLPDTIGATIDLVIQSYPE